MLLARRGFLSGLLTTPAIIRTPGLLMAIKPKELKVWTSFGTGEGLTYESYIAFLQRYAKETGVIY